jgi:hypothetical protein
VLRAGLAEVGTKVVPGTKRSFHYTMSLLT